MFSVAVKGYGIVIWDDEGMWRTFSANESMSATLAARVELALESCPPATRPKRRPAPRSSRSREPTFSPWTATTARAAAGETDALTDRGALRRARAFSTVFGCCYHFPPASPETVTRCPRNCPQ